MHGQTSWSLSVTLQSHAEAETLVQCQVKLHTGLRPACATQQNNA